MTLGFSSNPLRGGAWLSRTKATTGIEPVSNAYRIRSIPVLVEPGPLGSPCHIWQGCVNSKGYPVRTVDKVRVLGHRAAYEAAHGPIPRGGQIHHVCETPRCVNPDHLEVVSSVEHTRHHVGRAAERAEALLADGNWWKLSRICRTLPGESPDAVRQGLYRARLAGRVEGDGKGWYRLRGAA